MPYIGQEAATTYSTRLAVQQFNGDGSTTAFTLNQSVSADQDILVSVDGVVQDTSAYTVSNGTTLTFSPAPSSGTANIFVNYLGLAVGTVTHPATQGLTATTGTFSGKITADAGIDIDNFNIDGNTIALSSGHINLDSAGQIFLDGADEGTVQLKDTGTTYANFYSTSSDFYIKSMVSDKDIKFQGVDGGAQITALTLDMSAAGAATFNAGATFGGVVQPSSSNAIDLGTNGTEFRTLYVDTSIVASNALTVATGTNLTLDAAGDIILDSDTGNWRFKDGGTAILEISNISSGSPSLFSSVSDADMIFKGNDGGSAITALTLDMSAAGAATFNSSVTENSDERLKSNITTIPDALSKVTEMRGVHYIRKDTGLKRTGLIAQELQKIAPELVSTAEDEMSTLSVSYANVVGYLIEAVKELSEKVAALEAK